MQIADTFNAYLMFYLYFAATYNYFSFLLFIVCLVEFHSIYILTNWLWPMVPLTFRNKKKAANKYMENDAEWDSECVSEKKQ